MLIIKRHGIFIFWVILFLHCAMIYTGKQQYAQYTKLLIMPLLMVYLALNARKKLYPTSKIIVFVGLMTSFIGDILLSFDGKLYFLLGMSSFAITHICYACLFIRMAKVKFTRATEFILAAVLISIVSVKLLQFLTPYLGDMRMPVKIYMAIIAIMTATAANLLGNSLLKVLAAAFFVPGAALFVLSDIALALNYFLYQEPFLGVVVMMSYGYAQCLMVQGFTRYLRA